MQDRGTFVRWRLDIILYTVEIIIPKCIRKVGLAAGRERPRHRRGRRVGRVPGIRHSGRGRTCFHVEGELAVLALGSAWRGAGEEGAPRVASGLWPEPLQDSRHCHTYKVNLG